MPAELRGSVYTTSRGFGIRWIEHGRRRYRSGFESKKEARQWFTDEVRPGLNGRKPEPLDLDAFGVCRDVAAGARGKRGTIDDRDAALPPRSRPRGVRRHSAG